MTGLPPGFPAWLRSAQRTSEISANAPVVPDIFFDKKRRVIPSNGGIHGWKEAARWQKMDYRFRRIDVACDSWRSLKGEIHSRSNAFVGMPGFLPDGRKPSRNENARKYIAPAAKWDEQLMQFWWPAPRRNWLSRSNSTGHSLGY